MSEQRPGVIAAAAILFIIFGLFGVVVGGLLAAFSPVLAQVLGVENALAASFIGIISVILGFVEVVAGWLLWNMKRIGGILGFVSMSLSILFSLAMIPFRLPGTSVVEHLASIVISIVLGIFMIVLVALGWNYLR